jgi:coenzyme F420-dependent glucose-6-phosphate dehydrogenase
LKVRFGYRAVEERYQPSQLLKYAALADRAGFEFICISDHFHPWFHRGGCAGQAWVWLGAAGSVTKNVTMGTGVTTCIYRYDPAVVAQSFATLDEMYPGRIFLGIGSGEAMNEMPMAKEGQVWPPREELLERTVEAVEIIRTLWTRDFVDYRGKYNKLTAANLYTKPKKLIPIYFAASGPKAAHAAGRLGDALMTVGESELTPKIFGWFDEGAREAGKDPSKMPRMVEMKVSYGDDFDEALESTSMWIPVKGSLGIADPRELDRRREGVDPHCLADTVFTDIDPLIRDIEKLIKLGFNEVQLSSNSPDEEKLIRDFSAKALPYLKETYAE